MQGDFSKMTNIEDSSCDAVCAIESTCYASDPLIVYREIFRVLKPGAIFVESAWALTSKYIPGNPEHDKIKHEIMVRKTPHTKCIHWYILYLNIHLTLV